MWNRKRIREQAIALAGLWQALELVHQFARLGQLDSPQRKRFHSSIDSLFARMESEEDNPVRIFGGIHNLEYAFHGLAYQLEQGNKRHQVLVYMMQLLILQKRVASNAPITRKIADRLVDLQRQREYFTEESPQLVVNLADLYLDTLGGLPMRQRIRIYGKGEYLQNENVQQSIRALLLAALRAAMLWQQLGGSRVWLVFQRKQILRELYLLGERN